MPDGWSAMRTWVARYGEIHARYEPVFHSVENDQILGDMARRTGEETIGRFHARLEMTTLPPRQLDPVIWFLLECLNHALDVSGILRSVAPDAYPTEALEVAVTDVLHRTLFGIRPEVNVHAATGPPPPPLELGPEMLELLRAGWAGDPDGASNAALGALVTSGRDVFAERGFHDTRVDDLVAAAGVSHGAFYRYFKNKDELARILTAWAVQGVGTAVIEMPVLSKLEGSTGSSDLRRWLRRYHAAQANEAVMLRVWVDVSLQDPAIRTESAPLLDWGRRRMARNLRPRGFGDVDLEAVVMVALLGVFGARQRRPAEIEAAACIIERGLLGR